MSDSTISSAPTSGHHVSWKTLLLYAAPPIGMGYMFCLVSLYLLKFSTDILGIGAGVMGFILGMSRIWDAISDPLAGYLSDRTKTRWGRRRPWILGSIVPISISFWMVFSPPASLSDSQLVYWMACAVIGFYSAQTIFIVPHLSLGAELTDNHHDRNKIFGARHAGWIVGYILALGTLYLLLNAESVGPEQVRIIAADQSFYAAFITVIGLLVCAVGIREREEFSQFGPKNPFSAFKDVWQNGHARLLLTAIFIENIGSAVITIITVYNAEYVMKRADLAPLFILSYMIFSLVLVPVWTPLARRIGKKRLWVGSMVVTAFAFGGMGTLSEGDVWPLLILAAIAGTAGGCGGTINPSIKSDIIDYDEYMCGERKEGAYFAAWYFVSKMAYGIMLMVTGFALGWAGYVPKIADQADTVVYTLRFLYGGVPFICYILGACLLLRFAFNEREHAEVLAKLAERGREVKA
ncbi:MAG: MFS transporter [Alphaproteobacteria bacterium]|nr:MFS transporter [Alphaproteobacteria bacterium]